LTSTFGSVVRPHAKRPGATNIIEVINNKDFIPPLRKGLIGTQNKDPKELP
jgi:hypothetical protein